MMTFEKLQLVKELITQSTGLCYIKNYYILIVIDLSKQQELDVVSQAMQQINLLKIYNEIEIKQCFSFLKRQKKLF